MKTISQTQAQRSSGISCRIIKRYEMKVSSYVLANIFLVQFLHERHLIFDPFRDRLRSVAGP